MASFRVMMVFPVYPETVENLVNLVAKVIGMFEHQINILLHYE